MAKHILVIGTTISEWRENNNYIQTLFVGEACSDKQTSKKYQEIHPTKKTPGNKITFLTAWLRLYIYLQEVSWLAPVPQFSLTDIEIKGIA